MDQLLAKELGLAGTALIASAGLWWCASRLLNHGFSLQLSLLALLASLLWLMFMAMSLAFTQKRNLAALLIVCVSALLIIFGRLSLGAVSAAIIVIALLGTARAHARYELKSRRRYQTIPIFAPVTRYLLFALLVAAAGLSLTSLTSRLATSTFTIPANILEPIIADIAPSLSGGTTVNIGQIAEIAAATANQQLTALVNYNPLLTALAAIITLLLFSRLVVAILTWPALGLLALIVPFALRLKLLRWQSETITVKQLTL